MHIECNRLITFDEYLEAIRYTAYRPQRIAMFYGLIVLAILGWFIRSDVIIATLLFAFVAVVTALQLIHRYLILPSQFRREYDPKSGCMIILGTDGLSLEGVGIESNINWALFATYEVTSRLIIIRLPNLTFVAIPTRSLTEEQFAELIDFLMDRFGQPST